MLGTILILIATGILAYVFLICLYAIGVGDSSSVPGTVAMICVILFVLMIYNSPKIVGMKIMFSM